MKYEKRFKPSKPSPPNFSYIFHLLIPFFQNPPLPSPSKALFASFEGKRWESFEKKEWENGRNIRFWEGRALGVYYSS